jgi:hypothetical protein
VLFDAEPLATRAARRLNPSGADSTTVAELDFPGGRTARVECSFDRDAPVTLRMIFDSAVVTATGPIGAHHGHSVRIEPVDGPAEVLTVAGLTSFDYQLQEFVARVNGDGTALGRGDDIAANAAAIDGIRQAGPSDVLLPA